jgi:hypothetical protein
VLGDNACRRHGPLVAIDKLKFLSCDPPHSKDMRYRAGAKRSGMLETYRILRVLRLRE